MNEKFTLTEADRQSSLWVRLLSHMSDRLQDLRKKNDQHLPELETAKLRGRIECFKEFIRLGQESPIIDD